jgi:acetolactate synthase I/II/III large subunit
MSLGVALANKDTGRLVVDLQPDGDLMYDAGVLWIAAKYQIPLLVVVYNNRLLQRLESSDRHGAQKAGASP